MSKITKKRAKSNLKKYKISYPKPKWWSRAQRRNHNV